jgi:DNA-binding MarR family transcriptional regulator
MSVQPENDHRPTVVQVVRVTRIGVAFRQWEAHHSEVPHDLDLDVDAPVEMSAVALSELYIAHHHRLKRVVDEAMQGAGLSMARAKLLDQLMTQGPMRQQALADCFGFAPRSITDMVDGLERDGLAERLDDPGDRRAKLVRITAAGELAVNAALRVRGELIQHIFGVLLPADRVELARLLALLDESLASVPEPHLPLV